MKILYLAKHGSGGNDDEGAIHSALTNMGHEVHCVPEKLLDSIRIKPDLYDFMLMHHFSQPSKLKDIPLFKVFWCFDKVELPDASLRQSTEARISWITEMTSVCNMGFCTDGDWVAKDTTTRLHWLPQGADSRYVGRGTPLSWSCDVLFAGSAAYGTHRFQQLQRISSRYLSRYRGLMGSEQLYRREFADAIASSKIVIAPMSPSTSRYWSNRVYIVSGYQGFLIHPYCEELAKEYTDKENIVFYVGEHDMFHQIDSYLDKPEERERISRNAFKRTVRYHTYHARCIRLMKRVQACL